VHLPSIFHHLSCHSLLAQYRQTQAWSAALVHCQPSLQKIANRLAWAIFIWLSGSFLGGAVLYWLLIYLALEWAINAWSLYFTWLDVVTSFIVGCKTDVRELYCKYPVKSFHVQWGQTWLTGHLRMNENFNTVIFWPDMYSQLKATLRPVKGRQWSLGSDDSHTDRNTRLFYSSRIPVGLWVSHTPLYSQQTCSASLRGLLGNCAIHPSTSFIEEVQMVACTCAVE